MAKKNKPKANFQLRPSTWFLLLILLNSVPFFFLDVIKPFILIGIFLWVKHKGYVKDFKALDFLLIMIYLIASTALFIYMQWITFKTIPWYMIILIGIIADVVATIFGAIPIIGDAVSAMINFFIPVIIVGGLTGVMIGVALMMISLIPGPSMGANTIALIVLKALSLII